jgi:hypothetical protein
MKRAIALVALLHVLLAVPGSVHAQQCDFSQNGWMDPVTSMDNDIIKYWCSGAPASTSANVQYYWDSLYLGEDDYWEQPLDCADPNQHYIRLLNAAAALQAIFRSLQNTSRPSQSAWAYNYLDDFVWPHSTNSYTADCDYDTIASNPDWPSTGSTILHYQFFWKRSAPIRASTLVHEATHDDVGHESDDSCPRGGSCDVMYGLYNAQTMQINSLDQMVRAYQKNFATNELEVANLGSDTCGFLPFLSPAARVEASTLIRDKIDNNFTSSAFGPPGMCYQYTSDPKQKYGDYKWLVDGEGYEHARWDCAKICKLADFMPNGAKACNEQWQTGNTAVNQANYATCTDANAKVAAGLTPQQYTKAVLDFYWALKPCIPGVSDAYLTQYCSGLSASASNVTSIEAGWTLPDQVGYFDSDAAMVDCQRTYCDQKFQASWVTTARTACYEWDDPGFGCMKEMCGDLAALKTSYGDTSKEYFMAVQCRRHYFENGGDTQAYVDQQQVEDVCKKVYVECKNSEAYAAWAKGKGAGTCSLFVAGLPVPSAGQYNLAALADMDSMDYTTFNASHATAPIDKCVSAQKLCEAARALAAKLVSETILASKQPYAISSLLNKPNPSPYTTYRSPIDANMRGLAEVAAGSQMRRAVTPKAARRFLAATPEMLHSLSLGMGKNNFFATFGTKNLERVFGAAALTKYAGAQIKIDDSADAALKTALQNADAFRKTRERCESQATSDLLATAAGKLTRAQLYGFMQAITKADSAAQLDAALDQIGAAIK